MIEDRWLTIAGDEDLPIDVPVIVELERFQNQRDELLRRNAPLGVRLQSDQPPSEIAEDLDRFEVVALEFPKFTDGRAFSYARQLRDHYRYQGEVRAVGHVLRDQYMFLDRCGFDTLEVADKNAAEGWRAANKEFSVWYQPASGDETPAMVLRHRASAAD
ncbi:MAG: DUF934 domain-containing protein [Alphaproteobacteria bacterium]